MPHKFGFVALAGVPNVGKSTLLNNLVGEKVSITSRKPQTTRHRILGILNQDDSQLVFVDTPGLHRDHRKSLNRVINKTAVSSFMDVDLILFMIDGKGWNEELLKVFEGVRKAEVPVILVINKIDRITDKSLLLPLMAESAKVHDFSEIVPISALSIKDYPELMNAILGHVPEGPAGFPAEQITDRSERFLATELVREQVFLHLGQELPYSIATQCIRFEENDKGTLMVDMVIWVEKPGQKVIVIGNKGAMLKKIGTAARRQIEHSSGKKVYLNLWVKVKKGWADQDAQLRSLGYIDNAL